MMMMFLPMGGGNANAPRDPNTTYRIPKRDEDLTTTVRFLLPLALFALLPSIAIHFLQVELFVGLSAVVFFAVIVAIRHVQTARRVLLTAFERNFLSVFIVIFFVLTLISFSFDSIAKYAITTSFITIIVPHMWILWRMRAQVNLTLEFTRSAILLSGCIATAGYCYGQGVCGTILNSAVLVYGLVVLCQVMFMMREKIPFSTLRWVSLSLACAFTGSIIACYYRRLAPFPSTIAASACAIWLFGYSDWMFHQMRVPYAEWSNPDKKLRATCYVGIKFFSALIVGGYGWLGTYAGPDRIKSEGEFDAIMRTFLGLLFLHLIHSAFVLALQAKEPLDKKSSVGLASTVAVVAVKLCIAYSYFTVAYPFIIPEPVLLVFVASLYLLLIYSIGKCGQLLAPHYGKLALALVGVEVYLWFYISDELKKVYWIEPRKRVVLVAESFCIALIVHFLIGCCVEQRKQQRTQAAASVDTAESEAAPPPPAEDALREADSDYESGRE